MANPEHLSLLYGGVKRWNQWRVENIRTAVDLSGADLSEKTRRLELNLRGINFSGVNLSEVNLKWSELAEADFSGADLSGANLTGVILTWANLTRANLMGADLTRADLSGADFSRADLSRSTLGGVTLSGTNFSGANLSHADIFEVSLRGADLRGAILTGVDLKEIDLSGVDLTGVNLGDVDLNQRNLDRYDFRGANLSRANLKWAKLSQANLSKANLRGAELGGAILTKADLRGADLSHANLSRAVFDGAVCEQVNFSEANLAAASLIDANLNGATLSGVCLWETQRAGWTIKGAICQHVYWDLKKKEISTFAPGDFERLYAEKIKILLKYPDGISALEIVTLPALIQHLESSHPGCKLRFESIQDASRGAVVTIVVEDVDDTPPEQMAVLRAAIQSEAEQKAQHLRQTLEDERQTTLLLKGEVQALERMVAKLFSDQKPSYYLEKGDVHVSEFKNTIRGNFQGAMGDNSQANNLTYNQIGSQIENSMDLFQLAGELSRLRQAMNQEAKETTQYIAIGEVAKAEEAAKAKDSSKVAESLKGAGKWALDVATKIGVSLATEAIKKSLSA